MSDTERTPVKGDPANNETTLEGWWSCFSCDYIGQECDDSGDDNGVDDETCPDCGTHSGDGFGMASYDPRYVVREKAE